MKRALMQGHSLIETLAALIIINTALLGLLHAQQSEERSERALFAHTLAVSALDDMESMFSMNPQAAAGYLTAYGAAPPGALDCIAASCSRMALAALQLTQWKCRLAHAPHWAARGLCRVSAARRAGLPEGDGRVRRRGAGVEISVRWRAGEDWRESSRFVEPPA